MRLLLLFLAIAGSLAGQVATYSKDAESVEDFTVDWKCATTPAAADCGDNTPASPNNITACAWSVPGGPAGLTKSDGACTATKSIARISGGVAGGNYLVRCKVTLTDGQVLVFPFRILIRRP